LPCAATAAHEFQGGVFRFACGASPGFDAHDACAVVFEGFSFQGFVAVAAFEDFVDGTPTCPIADGFFDLEVGGHGKGVTGGAFDDHGLDFAVAVAFNGRELFLIFSGHPINKMQQHASMIPPGGEGTRKNRKKAKI
jgi:hypothetical protein